MKVTGYKLREAIRMWELRRNMAVNNFDKSLYAFEGENKVGPAALMEQFAVADEAVAKLQTYQAVYNLAVEVDVLGRKMPLCQAIKLVGAAGRVEKIWRGAATDKKDRYSSYREQDNVRKSDEVYAKRTIEQHEAGALAAKAAKYAGALRAAIATGNAVEKEIDLEPNLFE